MKRVTDDEVGIIIGVVIAFALFISVYYLVHRRLPRTIVMLLKFYYSSMPCFGAIPVSVSHRAKPQ